MEDLQVTGPDPIFERDSARAIQAIRELDRVGTAVTFTAVAGQARVSRSWLYSQPDICRQIRQLREDTGRSTTAPIPASQRASDTSLLRRLETAHAENRRLSGEWWTERPSRRALLVRRGSGGIPTADSPLPAGRQGGRCSGLSAAGRACAACSCRRSRRPASGARPAASRVSPRRLRSSTCGA
jgi:hypothetical protein